MNIRRSKNLVLAFALAGAAGCADSTGPASLDADAALRSLSLGLSSASGGSLPLGLSPSALGTAGGLDRIDVAINGTTESMYALGLRVTYPAGTCIETIFIVPPSQGFPSGCTPPPLGLLLVLWQTTSGSRRPESLAIISADVGTSVFTFDFGVLPEETTDGALPEETVFSPLVPFAIYLNDRDEFWSSIAGLLNSQVAATSETCDVPAPLFAKASTCHVASFTESGRITFERFDFTLFDEGPVAARPLMELVIPPQTIRGILQSITQIQPITLPAQ